MPGRICGSFPGLLAAPGNVFLGTAPTHPILIRDNSCAEAMAASGAAQPSVNNGMAGLHGAGWTPLHDLHLITG